MNFAEKPQSQESESLEDVVDFSEKIKREETYGELEKVSRLVSRGIKIYECRDLEGVTAIIESRLKREPEISKIALEKLKSGKKLEDGDFLSPVADLENASFSVEEIERLLLAVENGSLEQELKALIEKEKNRILHRLENDEFLRELDKSMAAIKLMGLKIGESDLMERRWPHFVYAGRTGRMINRIKSINLFDTLACASGEYLHQNNTAYIYLASDSTDPAGKEILKTQVHENLHAVSPNQIEEKDGVKFNESGFGIIGYNETDPLASTNHLLSFNEGFTEYFARKFTKNSFGGKPIEKHVYDPNVAGVASFINFISKKTGLVGAEAEMKLFKYYVRGEKGEFENFVASLMGKYGVDVLDMLPADIDKFFDALLSESQDGAGITLEFSFEELVKRNVSIVDFKKEYPFVRVIKEEFNFETFEMVKQEIES